MRVLCLHGHRSNSAVTKSQTAPLQRELRQIIDDSTKIEFTYLQGSIESSPFPGKIIQYLRFTVHGGRYLGLNHENTIGVDALFSPPFYKFWAGDSPSSIIAAIELIASSISTVKPDVIFAHSEGGAAVLSTILHRPHNVKCLVLISSSPPFDTSGHKRLDFSVSGTPVHIPTLFVRGENDPMGHFVTLAEGLIDKRNLTVYSWKGGHEVPNSSERGMWAQIAQKLVAIVDKE